LWLRDDFLGVERRIAPDDGEEKEKNKV